MSRYFIDTADLIEVVDDDGIELPDRATLRDLLRKTLTAILSDEGGRSGMNECTAQAYDEDGKLVMSARATFSLVDQ